METSSLLLVSLTLLVAAPLPTLAYCPREYHYDLCYKLYSAVETALLTNQNLYQLREEFFPSSYKPPIYGHISFDLTVANTRSDSLCQSENDTEGAGGQEDISTAYNFIWTSSGLLGRIDPNIISFYQLELLSLIYGTVGILDYSYNTLRSQPSLIQLTLELDVEGLPCRPTPRQLKTALADLASWAKVYAATQGPLTSPWNVHDKGYAIPISDTSTGSDYGILFAACICLSLSITVVLWVTTKEAFAAVAKKAEVGNCCCIFWAAAIVVPIVNVALIAAEPIRIFFGHSSMSHEMMWLDATPWGRAFLLTKELQVIILVVLDVMVGAAIGYWSDVQFPIPAALEAFTDLFMFCCASWDETPGYKPKRARFLHTIALSNFLILAHLLTIAAIPTLLWFFVLPLRMLSVTALLVVCVLILISLIAMVFSLLPITVPAPEDKAKGPAKKRKKKQKNPCKIALHFFLVLVLFAPVVTLLILYLSLITTEMTTDTPTDKLESFLPTAALTVLLWILGLKVKGNLKNEPRENGTEEEMTPLLQPGSEDEDENQ